MYQQLFFGAACVGVLMAAGLMPLPERENLPPAIAKFDLNDLSLPDSEVVLSDIQAVMDQLPVISARVEEKVIRPTIQRISTAIQPTPTPTPAMPAELALPVSQPQIGFATVVTFDLDTADLDEDAIANLNVLAVALENSPTAKLAIFGHTDLTGSDAYNMTLGQARADQVAAYLTAAGVAPDRIDLVKSFGETAPRVKTQAPLRDNRRVHIELM
ncbi:MAG: OmpA family protein [Pseudomonadota bacterium]